MAKKNLREVYSNQITVDGQSPKDIMDYKPSLNLGDMYRTFDQDKQINANMGSMSNISDTYDNASDYGNSVYDKEITDEVDLNDLENARARIQPFSHKLGIGLATFAGKTMTATAGGTVGIVNGIYQALSEGRFSAYYDNDFNKAIDNINSDIENNAKVYMSKAERDGSFFDQSIGSAHFWTKSLLGDGLSFTAGAILSAGGWGKVAQGVGILAKAASIEASTIAKYGESVARGIEGINGNFIEGFNNPKFLANAANKLRALTSTLDESSVGVSSLLQGGSKASAFMRGSKELANIAGKFVTGASYEAGVEANDFLKTQRDSYAAQWKEKYGNPTDENGINAFNSAMADYDKKLLPAANALFAGNLALVGMSNMVTLPHVFGAKFGAARASLNALNEIGENGVMRAIEKSTASKIFGGIKSAARPLVSEGIREEGGQNFMKTLAGDYMDRTYNVNSAKNTFDLMSGLGNAFEKAYTTTDGWKEILSGMIIGGLGAPNVGNIMKSTSKNEDGTRSFSPNLMDHEKSWWSGGILGEFQEEHANKKAAETLRNDYNKYNVEDALNYAKGNQATGQGLMANISGAVFMNSTINNFDEAMSNGDFNAAESASADIEFALMRTREEAGYGDLIESDYIQPIERMSNEDYAESFGLDGMTDDEISNHKKNAIAKSRERHSQVKNAIKVADQLLGSNSVSYTDEDFSRRNALIYAISTISDVEGRINKAKDIIKSSMNDGTMSHGYDENYYKQQEAIIETYLNKTNKRKEHLESIVNDENANKSSKKYKKAVSELSEINKQIDDINSKSDKLNESKKSAIENKNLLESISETSNYVETNSKNVQSAFEMAQKLQGIIKNSVISNPDPNLDVKRVEALNELKKLIYLVRRKEEAIELYSTSKNADNYKNFLKSNRVQNKIKKSMEDFYRSVVEEHNNAVQNATESIENDNDPSPEAIDELSEETLRSISDNIKKTRAAKMQRSVEKLLEVLNRDFGLELDNIDDLLNLLDLLEQTQDENALSFVDQISKKLERLGYESKRKEQPPSPVITPSVSGTDISDLSVDNSDNDKKIDEVLDSIDTDINKLNPSKGIASDVVHFDLNFATDPNTGKRYDTGINTLASNLAMSFRRLNTNSKISLEIDDNYDGYIYAYNGDGTTTRVLWSEFKKNNPKGSESYARNVPIKITSNNETVGFVRATGYIEKNMPNHKSASIENLNIRNAVINNGKIDSKITNRSIGRLFRSNENMQSSEALGGGVISYATLVNNQIVGYKPLNSEILINRDLSKVGNGPVAIINVGTNKDGKSLIMAVPLSASKLNSSDSGGLATMMTLFFKNLTGELSESEKSTFNSMANDIKDVLGDLELQSKAISFDIRTLEGLRNYISLFSHVNKFSNINQFRNSGKPSKSGISISTASSNGLSFTTIMFGTGENASAYKFSEVESNGVKKVIVGKLIKGTDNYQYEIENNDGTKNKNLGVNDFKEFHDDMISAFSGLYFNSNKLFNGLEANIPSVLPNGNVSVSSKNYNEHVSKNTNTNIRGFNIGTKSYEDWVYTFQSDLNFDLSVLSNNESTGKSVNEPSDPNKRSDNSQIALIANAESESIEDLQSEYNDKAESLGTLLSISTEVDNSVLNGTPVENLESEIDFDMDAFDMPLSENKFDNGDVHFEKMSSEDLESRYIEFIKNDLNSEQRAILRSQINSGLIDVKCN